MVLARFVKTLDGVDEAYRPLYTEKSDGSGFAATEIDWSDLDDTKKKLDEFRGNNRKLHTENESYKTKFADVDPEKYAEGVAAIETLAGIDPKKLEGNEDYEEALEKRVGSIRADYEKKSAAQQRALDAMTAENTKNSGALDGVLIERDILGAVKAVGNLKKGAERDVMGRARDTWRRVDGKLTAFDSDGSPIFDGGEEITPEGWGRRLFDEAAFMFVDAKGGDAGGGTPGAGEGARSIDGNDQAAFGRNLTEIASGKVTAR